MMTIHSWSLQHLPTCDTYDNNENWRDELRDEVLSGSRAKKQTFNENDSEEEDESTVAQKYIHEFFEIRDRVFEIHF